MRKSELFDAYLSDSLTNAEAEELKKVLSTEEGSKEFMLYITETQLMCEILEKNEEINKSTKAPKQMLIPFAGLTAVAALIALIFFIKTPTDPEPEITVIRKPPEKENINPAPKVYTSKEISNFELIDGTVVNSSGNGRMTVVDKDNVEVAGGHFFFKVKPRHGSTTFKIKLTNGMIEVIGTAFDIIDTPEKSSVSVTEGIVKFTHDGKEVLLKAGDSVSADNRVVEKFETDNRNRLELFLDGDYTTDKAAFRDSSGNERTGWASWNPGDEGAVRQVFDDGNPAIAFTKSGRLGVKKIDLNGPFTLSCWLKPGGTLKDSQTMISNGNSSWQLSMHRTTLKPQLVVKGLKPEEAIAAVPLAAGQWHCITGVFDGERLKIYINGILSSSVKSSGAVGQYNGNVEVAGNHEAKNRNLEGVLDGVRVYSRALNDMEVFQLFKSGRP